MAAKPIVVQTSRTKKGTYAPLRSILGAAKKGTGDKPVPSLANEE